MLPDTPMTTNLVGQKIGQYHLISQLGKNEFFTLYKAYYKGGYDYVIVKILHNALTQSPGFLDRFQNLPDTLSSLDHPTISQLYSCGTHDEIFYLVTEYIDGVTLSREIESRWQQNQSFTLPEICYILQVIGQAIDKAHACNLIHGYICPDNILFTIEGIPVLANIESIYLLHPTDRQPVLQEARPANPVTTIENDQQNDIEAFSWVLYQLVGGEIPHSFAPPSPIKLPEVARQTFSPPIASVLEVIVQKAIQPSSDNRFQHAIEMVDALQSLIPPEKTPITHISSIAQTSLVKQIKVATDTTSQFKALPGVCPYQGLFAFREENANFFFGRETFVEQLVNIVQQKPIIMVIGPSGSGKSSVVHAGLVPYLRQNGDWEIVDFRPGPQPIQALSAALSPLLAADMAAPERARKNYQLAEELRSGQTSLSELVAQILQNDDSGQQILLAIDQFEELYTLCRDDDLRHCFLDMILAATTAPVFQRKLVAVLTLRVDFLGQVLSHRAFADRLYQADIKLGPMNRNELGRAIENPAAQQGVTFEEGLVERILQDVGNEPGTLPLLQFALTQLWSEQNEGQLTHQAYESTNGVTGALARYADRVYQKLNHSEQEHARRVLMQLVRPGEGTEDTRRLAYRSELDNVDWQLAQRLADARLIVSGRTPDGQETVEVVHEALIWEWRKLRGWINEDRAFRTWQDRLRTAMRQWETSNQDEGALLRGALLVEAEDWFVERQVDLSQPEQNYIEASMALRKRYEIEKLERQRSKERSRRFIMISLTAGLVISSLMSIFAWFQWQQATDQQIIALSNQLAAQTLSRLESQEYDLAQLLSLEALQLIDSIESRSALLIGLQRSPYRKILRDYDSSVLTAVLGSDSQLLATLETNGDIELADGKTGQPINQLPHSHTGTINSIALSSDGQKLVSGDSIGKIIIWDISDPNDPKILQNIMHPASVSKVILSLDGQTLAVGGADSQVTLWNSVTGQQIGTPLSGHTGDVRSLAFSPNGQWLASGSVNKQWASMDEIVLLWDLTQEDPVSHQLFGLVDDVNDVAFSSDSRKIVASSANGDMMLWHVGNRKPISGLLHHIDQKQSQSISLPNVKIALSPDQKTLASGGADGEIVLWDLETSQPRQSPLPAHSGAVNHLEFSHDGHTLVSSNAEKAVILWAVDQQLGSYLSSLNHHFWSIAYNLDNSVSPQLVSGTEDGDIVIMDTISRQPVGQPITGHTSNVNTIAVSPVESEAFDGRIAASGSEDHTIRLWHLATGKPLMEPLVGHVDSILDVTFSPDGQILASASQDGSIIFWDTATFQQVGEPINAQGEGVWEVAFSPNGEILASASWDGSIVLWDMETREPLGAPLTKHKGPVVSVSASPVAPILASASRDKTIILWDMETGEPIRPPLQGHSASVWQVAFSPDGELLASVGCAQSTSQENCAQGEVRLWDVMTGRQIGQPFVGHGDVAWAVAFSPDGHNLASLSRDGSIVIWDVSQESWIDQACDIANRNLSAAEWLQYLGDEPYDETCDLSK